MTAESALSRFASSVAARASGIGIAGQPARVRQRPARLTVGAPVVGNLVAMMRERLWLIEQASAVRGGLCELPLAGRSVMVASSPELIHELLVTQADSFVKGTTFRFLRPILGDGLLMKIGRAHV